MDLYFVHIRHRNDIMTYDSRCLLSFSLCDVNESLRSASHVLYKYILFDVKLTRETIALLLTFENTFGRLCVKVCNASADVEALLF